MRPADRNKFASFQDAKPHWIDSGMILRAADQMGNAMIPVSTQAMELWR